MDGPEGDVAGNGIGEHVCRRRAVSHGVFMALCSRMGSGLPVFGGHSTQPCRVFSPTIAAVDMNNIQFYRPPMARNPRASAESPAFGGTGKVMATSQHDGRHKEPKALAEVKPGNTIAPCTDGYLGRHADTAGDVSAWDRGISHNRRLKSYNLTNVGGSKGTRHRYDGGSDGVGKDANEGRDSCLPSIEDLLCSVGRQTPLETNDDTPSETGTGGSFATNKQGDRAPPDAEFFNLDDCFRSPGPPTAMSTPVGDISADEGDEQAAFERIIPFPSKSTCATVDDISTPASSPPRDVSAPPVPKPARGESWPSCLADEELDKTETSNQRHERCPSAEHVDEIDYEVDRIVDKRTQYRVRWTGYGPGDDSWMLVDDLNAARGAINNYERRKQLKNSKCTHSRPPSQFTDSDSDAANDWATLPRAAKPTGRRHASEHFGETRKPKRGRSRKVR